MNFIYLLMGLKKLQCEKAYEFLKLTLLLFIMFMWPLVLNTTAVFPSLHSVNALLILLLLVYCYDPLFVYV